MAVTVTPFIPTPPAAPTPGAGKAGRAAKTAGSADEPSFSAVLKAEGEKAAQADENAASALSGAMAVTAQTPVPVVGDATPTGADAHPPENAAGPAPAASQPSAYLQGLLVNGAPAAQAPGEDQARSLLTSTQTDGAAHPGFPIIPGSSSSAQQGTQQPVSLAANAAPAQPEMIAPVAAGENETRQPASSVSVHPDARQIRSGREGSQSASESISSSAVGSPSKSAQPAIIVEQNTQPGNTQTKASTGGTVSPRFPSNTRQEGSHAVQAQPVSQVNAGDSDPVGVAEQARAEDHFGVSVTQTKIAEGSEPSPQPASKAPSSLGQQETPTQPETAKPSRTQDPRISAGEMKTPSARQVAEANQGIESIKQAGSSTRNAENAAAAPEDQPVQVSVSEESGRDPTNGLKSPGDEKSVKEASTQKNAPSSSPQTLSEVTPAVLDSPTDPRGAEVQPVERSRGSSSEAVTGNIKPERREAPIKNSGSKESKPVAQAAAPEVNNSTAPKSTASPAAHEGKKVALSGSEPTVNASTSKQPEAPVESASEALRQPAGSDENDVSKPAGPAESLVSKPRQTADPKIEPSGSQSGAVSLQDGKPSPSPILGNESTTKPVEEATAKANTQKLRSTQATSSAEPGNRGTESSSTSAEASVPLAGQGVDSRASSFAVQHRSDPLPREAAVQLANPIETLVRTGRPTLRVQLYPENLGHIELRLTSTAQGVGVTLIPEQSSTGRLLESQLNHLRQVLSDAGVQLNSLNIGAGSSQTPQGGQWQAPANSERTFSNPTQVKEELSNDEARPRVRHQTSQIDYRI